MILGGDIWVYPYVITLLDMKDSDRQVAKVTHKNSF